MALLRSKIDEILEQLRAEGRITTLSDSVVKKIEKDIHDEMEAYRHELVRKMVQSWRDIQHIVITC